jgi:hypothetical protein
VARCSGEGLRNTTTRLAAMGFAASDPRQRDACKRQVALLNEHSGAWE